MNNFLVPLFGVLWGMTFLDERPAGHAFVALCLVLGGLAAPQLWPRLVTAGRGRKRRQPASPNTSAIE
jgi:drug/metabolite transporter (DMT)-like permease